MLCVCEEGVCLLLAYSVHIIVCPCKASSARRAPARPFNASRFGRARRRTTVHFAHLCVTVCGVVWCCVVLCGVLVCTMRACTGLCPHGVRVRVRVRVRVGGAGPLGVPRVASWT